MSPRLIGRFVVVITVVATLRFAPAGFAQSRSKPTTTEQKLAAQLAVKSVNVQTLSPTIDADGGAAIDVRLGDRAVTLHVAPFSLRSDDFQLVTYDTAGNPTIVPPPDVHTYRGTIGFDESTRVAATINAGHITALLRDDDGEIWGIQPVTDFLPIADPSAHVVYPADGMTFKGAVCGADTIVAPTAGGAPRGSNTSCEPIVANLALVGDYELYQYHGSDVAATMDAMETIVNAMSYIYEEELGITYNLVRIDIWSGGNFFVVVPDVNGEIDHNLLLETFKNWYNANLPGVNRRFAHMLSGRNFVGAVIGLAITGVPCNVTAAYGIDQMDSNNLVRNAGLLSHEVGHNWGAGHCDGTPGCDIMNSALGEPTTFGPVATNQIIGPGAPLYQCITPAVGAAPDCNHNHYCDDLEIATGLAQDTNGDGVPDDCQRVHNMVQGNYYKTIKAAIDEANNGDTIIVAPGTYYEAVDFRDKNIILRSSGDRYVTAIDASGLGRSGVALNMGQLRGFTIRGANGGDVFVNAGGGVEVTSGTPLIRECVVRDNILPNGDLGGGFFIHDGALPTLQTVIVCSNSPQAIYGSYTNQGVSFPSNCPPFLACATTLGDVNGDNTVNGKDITSFIDCYLGGSTGFGDCDCADIVSDGHVDNNDLQVFISRLTSP